MEAKRRVSPLGDLPAKNWPPCRYEQDPKRLPPRCTTTTKKLARAQVAAVRVVEACVLPVYVVLAFPPSLVGVAAVLAVIRANKDDLPEIVRALMRMGPRGDEGSRGRRKTPPSLPRS